MYGKNIKDYMTKEDYEIWLNKVRNNKQGEKNPSHDKKWMYNSNTNERIYVKSNEVQKYLNLGFVLGQNYKANLGKKRMYLPGSDMYGKMIKNEDI
jgi:hypothetical protein